MLFLWLTLLQHYNGLYIPYREIKQGRIFSNAGYFDVVVVS